MYGFVPAKFPMLFSRLSENVFGSDVLPAKSGKDENSMEKETKASRGTPALEGVLPSTDMTEDCLGGRTGTSWEDPSEPNASNTRIAKDIAMFEA
jgi:hypothetical protein